MANYEMIGVKMGFDSTEVTKGTQKAKGDVDKLKQSLGPISEQLGKWGLSFVAPLAAVGKLTQAVIEFGRNSESSANDAERALYKLTTAFDGISESVVAATGRGVGKLAQFGDTLGDSFTKWWNWQLELIGAQEKGTGALIAKQTKWNEEQTAYNAQHKKQLEEIAKLEEKNVDALNKTKEKKEQLAIINEKIAAQQAIMAKSDEKSDAYLNARIEKLKLEQSQIALNADVEKEAAASNLKSAEILEKAKKDGQEKEQARAEKRRESMRISREEELEYFKLSAKKAGDLTSEETKRLEVLKLQMKEKSLSVQLEQAQDDYAKSGAKADQEKLLTLVKQTEEVKKQIADKTQLKANVEDIKAAEVELLGTLKDQTLEVKRRMSVGRVGTVYENQSDFDLAQAQKRLFNEMESVRTRNIGNAALPEWYKESILGPYKVELDAIRKELDQRKMDAKLEEERLAWEKEHGVKQLNNDEKMLSLSERMTKQLENLNARFNAAGLTTTPRVNT